MMRMRRYLLMAVVSLLASPSWAMEHYVNVVQDQQGSAIPGTQISVYVSGTSNLADLFSDNGVTGKPNPFTNRSNGSYDFYAENGVYDIRFHRSGSVFSTMNETHSRISLFDVNDSSIGGGGGVGGWPSSSGTKEVTWANSLANALLISGGGVRKWAFYDDATDGLQMRCVVSGVPDACNIIRLLGSGFRLEYTNSSSTPIFTLTESTGALTNVTLNGESTGNTITLTEESWFDVVACQESTAQHIWNTITATFPAATCDTGSNTQKGYASFDATTDEAIQMDWVLPTGWTGAIDIHFIWKAAATSGATGWCAQLIRVADASTSDPAFPAQAAGNCVSDTAKGTTLQENHATISGVTCSSCAARDHVYVRISRDANGGAVTDDMTGDAHLMKVGRTWRVAH